MSTTSHSPRNNKLEESNILTDMIFKTTALLFKPLQKDQFRIQIFVEDLTELALMGAKDITYEREDGFIHNRIKALVKPIPFYDSYNPLQHILDKRIANGSISLSEIEEYGVKGYENPARISKIGNRILGIIGSLALMNRGATPFAKRQITKYIVDTHIQGSAINWDAIHNMVSDAIDKLSDEQILTWLRTHQANNMRNKVVFFTQKWRNEDGSWQVYGTEEALTVKEKRGIVLRELNNRVRRARRTLIDESINALEIQNAFTQITTARISKLSGLARTTVTRNVSTRQKIRIKKMNLDRYFKTDTKGDKFLQYVDDYDNINLMTVRAACKHLKIDAKTYHDFIGVLDEIIED